MNFYLIVKLFLWHYTSYAEFVWNYECNVLGWSAPPNDGACGGYNDKYDIYVKYIDSYGLTQHETRVGLTNGYTSFIEIGNLISIRPGDPYRQLSDEELKVTIAHEFHHAIQDGYNSTKFINNNEQIWFYENTSTWMEEIVYPEINEWITFFINDIYNQNFKTPLNNPFLPIDYLNGNYQYSGALFCHMLSRWFDNQFIKSIWVYAKQSNSSFLNDVNSVLINNGTNLKEALKRYAAWRYFTGERDDGNHFPKGHLYNSSKIFREHSTGIGNGNSSPDDLYSKGGTSYIVFKNAEGVIDVNFNGQDNFEFSAIALNKRVFFSDIENNFNLNSQNDGILQNLSCIGDDYVVLIPILTDWQIPTSINSYTYSSVLGPGISTSFWTEKESYNLNSILTLQRSSLINSGSSKNLANQLDYNVFTNEERFLSIGGKNVKHNRWNDLTNKNFLNQQFGARNDNNRQSAKYENMEYSRIESRLEGQLIQDKGEFEFQDPWYVKSDLSQPGNYWIPCISSYEPTGKEGATEKGVFLNQGWPGWNPPYYSVKAISPQPITINGRTHNFYFQNWSRDFINGEPSAEFQDSMALQTGVVFKKENAVVKANMKGTQLSNDQNAYANNSQRKFVRGFNQLGGGYFSTYTSMDKVWLELNDNTGWVLLNNGKPLSDNESKNPSIDYWEKDALETYAFLVYQEKNSGSGYSIKIKVFNQDNISVLYSGEVINETSESFETDAVPVIAIGKGFDNTYPQTIMVCWYKKENSDNRPAGLYFKYGYFRDNVVTWLTSNPIRITVTSTSSKNISLSAPKQIVDPYILEIPFHLTYEESNQINYKKIKLRGNGGFSQPEQSINISTGSGYRNNYHPSIVAFADTSARICWIGERRDDERQNFIEGNSKSVVFTASDNLGRYWTFGSNVNSVSINRTNSCYTIAWASDDETPIKYTDCSTLREVYSLGIKGKYVQLSNGTTPTTMRALAFNTTTQPYYMQTSRVHSDEPPIRTDEKREGILSEAEAQVYFNIGDIKVDEEQVSFVEIPDTASINSLQTANKYLESLPFNLTDNSEFFYSVQYGLTDSLLALNMLSGEKSITFKVELLDAQTNEVLGVFDEVTYDQNNLTPYEKIDYQVLTNGIGERLVKMRLIISNNFTPEYSVAEKYDEPSGLAKKIYKQINYQGGLAVKEYALDQNYPNPFNPSTKLTWQSPVGSHQTLKVYDVLGREVTTLVNEWREAGRYSVDFNASDLASGVYIYQLRVNDYVATKKLMLVK